MVSWTDHPDPVPTVLTGTHIEANRAGKGLTYLFFAVSYQDIFSCSIGLSSFEIDKENKEGKKAQPIHLFGNSGGRPNMKLPGNTHKTNMPKQLIKWSGACVCFCQGCPTCLGQESKGQSSHYFPFDRSTSSGLAVSEVSSVFRFPPAQVLSLLSSSNFHPH